MKLNLSLDLTTISGEELIKIMTDCVAELNNRLNADVNTKKFIFLPDSESKWLHEWMVKNKELTPYAMRKKLADLGKKYPPSLVYNHRRLVNISSTRINVPTKLIERCSPEQKNFLIKWIKEHPDITGKKAQAVIQKQTGLIYPITAIYQYRCIAKVSKPSPANQLFKANKLKPTNIPAKPAD